MSRHRVQSDIARCAPDCELAHPQLAFETSECAQLHRLLEARRENEPGVVRYLQRRLSQRELGARAFTRATGQHLPAIVQVHPPDAEPFQLALLEVFPGEPRHGEPRWCAGGYYLQSGAVPGYEWRVADLAQVRFEESFTRGAGRLSRGRARLGALCAGLRERLLRRLRPDNTVAACASRTSAAATTPASAPAQAAGETRGAPPRLAPTEGLEAPAPRRRPASAGAASDAVACEAKVSEVLTP